MQAKISRLNVYITQSKVTEIHQASALVYTTDPMLSVPAEYSALFSEQAIRYLQQVGWADVGSAVIVPTQTAGNIAFLIGVVPPRWGEGSERGKLANAIWEVLSTAETHRVRAVALPPIGVGSSGYPLENCAKTMLEQMIDFAFEPLKALKHAYLCTGDAYTQQLFIQEFQSQLAALPKKARDFVTVS